MSELKDPVFRVYVLMLLDTGIDNQIIGVYDQEDTALRVRRTLNKVLEAANSERIVSIYKFPLNQLIGEEEECTSASSDSKTTGS